MSERNAFGFFIDDVIAIVVLVFDKNTYFSVFADVIGFTIILFEAVLKNRGLLSMGYSYTLHAFVYIVVITISVFGSKLKFRFNMQKHVYSH